MCVCTCSIICVYVCVFNHMRACVQSYGGGLCVGESGFGRSVLIYRGFLLSVGIGDKGIMSSVLGLYIDCGNDVVRGDVVVCISVDVMSCVGCLVWVGVNVPDGIYASAAHCVTLLGVVFVVVVLLGVVVQGLLLIGVVVAVRAVPWVSGLAVVSVVALVVVGVVVLVVSAFGP